METEKIPDEFVVTGLAAYNTALFAMMKDGPFHGDADSAVRGYTAGFNACRSQMLTERTRVLAEIEK